VTALISLFTRLCGADVPTGVILALAVGTTLGRAANIRRMPGGGKVRWKQNHRARRAHSGATSGVELECSLPES